MEKLPKSISEYILLFVPFRTFLEIYSNSKKEIKKKQLSIYLKNCSPRITVELVCKYYYHDYENDYGLQILEEAYNIDNGISCKPNDIYYAICNNNFEYFEFLYNKGKFSRQHITQLVCSDGSRKMIDLLYKKKYAIYEDDLYITFEEHNFEVMDYLLAIPNKFPVKKAYINRSIKSGNTQFIGVIQKYK